MIIRLKWKKISNTLPMAKCWYCQSPTNSALYELDGSELWCCENCYKKHGKIYKRTSKKKLARILHKRYIRNEEKTRGERQQSLSFAVASNSLDSERKNG